MKSKKHLKPTLLANLVECKGFIGATCKLTGIHTSTYNEWQKEDPEFKAAAEQIIDLATEEIKKAVVDLALEDKHFPAMKYVIETRFFRERERDNNIITNAPDGSKVVVYLPEKDKEPDEEK